MPLLDRTSCREEPIVISGFGCLTPAGRCRAELWDSFREGRSGVGRIGAFDPASHGVQIAGEVRGPDPLGEFGRKDRPHVSRAAALALGASRQALGDARVAHEALDVAARRRIGVVIGSGGGGLGFTELQYARYFGGRFRQASVYTIPTSTTGTLSSEISMAFGFHGPSHVISTGCTSSTDAIYYAAVQVAAGTADMVVTGGVDATIAPGILAGFELMRVLTGSWNSEPERASRPFSGDRDGFVLGEGAWIYVVEPASRARERGAPVYAEVAGYASTCDAHHRVRPDESGTEPARAMTLALARAGLAGGAPDYISLHGTSTVLNDRIETRAVRQALGPRAVSTPLSAPKSIFGHPQGAAGAAGVSAALFAIAENRIPPTLNLEESDPECDLDYTPRIGRAHPVEVALANCIGFGSKNSALVLRRAGSS